jgi:hypothetical protein
MHKDNKSGLKGAYFMKSKKGPKNWYSVICVNGTKISLGYFQTKEKAAAAYAEAAVKYHGEFRRM